MKKKISIVTPYFETGNVFLSTIKSVFSQLFVDFEWIIVDDCSKKNTCHEILQLSGFSEDERIRVIELKNNRGPNFAREIAIRNSECEYIAFLDSDDTWSENKLYDQYYFMVKNNICLSHSYTKKFSEKGISQTFISLPKVNWLSFVLLRKFPVNTVMVKTDLALKAIESRVCLSQKIERKFPGEDILLFESIIHHAKYSYCIKEVLSQYRVWNSRSSKILNSLFGIVIYFFSIVNYRKKIYLIALLPIVFISVIHSRFKHRINYEY